MIDYRLVTALPDKLEQHHLITYPESPLLRLLVGNHAPGREARVAVARGHALGVAAVPGGQVNLRLPGTGGHESDKVAVRRKSGNRPVPNAPPLPYRVRRMLLHSVFTGRSGLLRRWGRCRLGRLRLCGGRIFRETLHLRAKRG